MADAMKLLPCPMCGGEAALVDYEARYGGLHYASRCPQCTSCGCSMGYLPTAKKAVEAWNCRASMPAPEKAPSFADARRKLIHCIEQWDGETEYDAEDIAALADDILDAFGGPPAREEAPAEGAVELDGTDAAHPAWWRGHEQTAQVFCQKVVSILDGEDDGSGVANDPWESVRRRLIALRDRTSEPEAGEAGPPREPTQAPDSWRPVKAKWAGDRSVLGVGWDVEVLKSDPIPGEIIDGHQLSRILARTACWIRCWPEGRDFPMYRSCDLADLDLSDADFDQLAVLRPQTAESGK